MSGFDFIQCFIEFARPIGDLLGLRGRYCPPFELSRPFDTGHLLKPGAEAASQFFQVPLEPLKIKLAVLPVRDCIKNYPNLHPAALAEPLPFSYFPATPGAIQHMFSSSDEPLLDFRYLMLDASR